MLLVWALSSGFFSGYGGGDYDSFGGNDSYDDSYDNFGGMGQNFSQDNSVSHS